MKRRLVITEPDDEPENTLPLINIVFLLLIFFMIAGAIEKADLFDINPPEGLAQDQQQDDALAIGMAKDGRLSFRGEEREREELVRLLRQVADKGKAIQIKADAGLDTVKILVLLEDLKSLPSSRIDVLVSKKSGL